jgi:acyl-CoA-binding protein
MSKMGNLHFQAQEDARDGTMDKKSFLDEYGDCALEIWEEFNGDTKEDMKQLVLKEIDDFMSDAPDYDDRKKSYFGQSLEEQSDYEVQTEHWNKERA